MQNNKLLKNEEMFRSVNQRMTKETARLTPGVFPSDFMLELYCECANKVCEERLGITHQEYATISRNPAAFVVKPEHYLPEYERVVKVTPEYLVIVKKPEKLNKPFEV